MMLRSADRTERRWIRTDSWFSYPPDRTDQYTTWRVGWLELQRHRITGHHDLDLTVSAEGTRWKLTVERPAI